MQATQLTTTSTYTMHQLNWKRNRLTQSKLRPDGPPPRSIDGIDNQHGADLRDGLEQPEGLLETGQRVGEIGELFRQGWHVRRKQRDSKQCM